MAFIAAQKSIDVFSQQFMPWPQSSLVLVATDVSFVARHPDGDSTAATGTFAYPSPGARVEPTGGTIVDYSVTLEAGDKQFDATGASIDVAQFYAFRAAGDAAGFAAHALRGDDTIFGSGDADTIAGFGGADTLNGNPGDDLVFGNAGADRVIGGSGADWLFGGQGADTVLGGPGDDPFVAGNIGDDLIFGNLGNDTMYGGQGADTMVGDDGDGSGNGGADLMFGDRGDDDLYGDYGNDTLVGGTGADRFFFFTGEGDDLIRDFQPGEGDRIGIEIAINGSGVTNFTELKPHIASDGRGGSVIDLGDGNSVTVEQVAPGAFTQDMFQFFF
ncbi:MAG: calcium-binding protein [Alphaproteobacteria bacterium]|nr:calcium-binding protein [Alphaproteobacteria bacterium]